MNQEENKTIFIVEDETFNINVLVDILKPRYNLVICKEGNKALDKIKKVSPDLILLDVMLPGLNGFEICKLLKEELMTLNIPVIFMTSKQETDDIVKGFELGAVDYVRKPINYMELLSRVKTHFILSGYIEELKEKRDKISKLRKLIPICPVCKKVQDKDGLWEKVESFLDDNSEIELSHSICPDCLKKHYPDYYEHFSRIKHNKANIPKKYRNRILIVEDELFNIKVLVDILKDEYKVTVVKDGSKALEMASKNEYDLILLDILLPGMDGFTICEKLKENPKSQDIPVLFMTVKRDTNDIIKGFQIGAVDYLIKPINYKELTARVKTHTNIRKTIEKLKNAQHEIRTLTGMLPICSHCKKIRDDKGYWNEVDEYFSSKSSLEFKENICPVCKAKLDREN